MAGPNPEVVLEAISEVKKMTVPCEAKMMDAMIKKIAAALGLNSSQVIPCSSLNREGLDEVLSAIERFMQTPYVNPELSEEIEEERG